MISTQCFLTKKPKKLKLLKVKLKRSRSLQNIFGVQWFSAKPPPGRAGNVQTRPLVLSMGAACGHWGWAGRDDEFSRGCPGWKCRLCSTCGPMFSAHREYTTVREHPSEVHFRWVTMSMALTPGKPGQCARTTDTGGKLQEGNVRLLAVALFYKMSAPPAPRLRAAPFGTRHRVAVRH